MIEEYISSIMKKMTRPSLCSKKQEYYDLIAYKTALVAGLNKGTHFNILKN